MASSTRWAEAAVSLGLISNKEKFPPWGARALLGTVKALMLQSSLAGPCGAVSPSFLGSPVLAMGTRQWQGSPLPLYVNNLSVSFCLLTPQCSCCLGFWAYTGSCLHHLLLPVRISPHPILSHRSVPQGRETRELWLSSAFPSPSLAHSPAGPGN